MAPLPPPLPSPRQPAEGLRADPVKVAFVMPGIGIERRGAEAFVTDLATALLADGGFEVTLFCRGETSLPHRKIRALPRDSAGVNRLYRKTRLGRKILDTLFLDPLSLEWYTAALSAFPGLWRGRYDVLVMEGGLVGAWLARLLRRLRGTAFIDVAHGVDPKWEGAFARQRPDRVVVFTQAAADALQRLAPRARIAVIPHGIDLDLYRPEGDPGVPDPKVSGTFTDPDMSAPPARSPKVSDTSAAAAPARSRKVPGTSPRDVLPNVSDTSVDTSAAAAMPRPVVLAVGAVDAHKRMELLVEAVATMPEAPSLVLLGDGPRAAAVDALAAARLEEGRYLRRVVAREDLPSWYRAADVFTLPSLTESFGLVYVEALACGTPVVAPDDAVRREVIGNAGLFCDVTDPSAYGRALAAALARDWGDLPRRRGETFPAAGTVRAYVRLCRELSGREGGETPP